MKKLYSLMLMFVFTFSAVLPVESDEIRLDNLGKVKDAMDDSSDVKDVVSPKVSEVFNPAHEPKGEELAGSSNLENNDLVLNALLNNLKNHPELAEDIEAEIKIHRASVNLLAKHPEIREQSAYRDPFKNQNDSQPMPKLTSNDIQGDIKIHKDIAQKYFGVQRVLEDLVRKFGGRLDYGPQQYLAQSNNEENLSEVERTLINNMKKIANLCRQAGEAHTKVANIFESFQALEKVEFEPGKQLQAMASDFIKQAVEASEQADKEMKELLGLKPIIKI